MKRFITKNYQKLILTQNAENDVQKLKTVKVNTDWIGDIVNEEDKLLIQENYIAFIPILESLIQTLLQADPTFSYNLILDKLDDRFINDAVYKNSIISLIKAIDNFNKNSVRNRQKTKVTILLRSDIFSLLSDTDLNKRESSNAVRIEWGDVAKYESPLFDLVVAKVKTSIPALQVKSKQEVISLLFPPHILQSKNRTVNTDKFLLGRTLFRPRDIIKYLTLVQEKNPSDSAFTGKTILDAQLRYSEYFIKEIKNEMNGHLREEQIEEVVDLVLKFGKFNFSYSEIERFERAKKVLTTLSLDEALKIMFDFSILGNYVVHNNMWRYTWKHRQDRVEVNFDKQLCLHYGLWRYFNVGG